MTEIEQLKAQIQELKKRTEKQTSFENRLKLVTAMVAVITIIVGVGQYIYSTRTDFRKIFWKEQYVLYGQACSAAAKIAMAGSINEVPRAHAKFWNLYWGELSIVEHPNVKDAMVQYGEQLKLVEAGSAKPWSLKQLSYHLARACRKSLAETWNPADLKDLVGEK